jgi:hypothetical protein
MILELRDHYEDLLAAHLESGLDQASAVRAARRALGADARIADAALGRRELLSWSARHPVLTSCARSAASVAAWPAVPVVFCAHRRSLIARWGASLSLAIVVTGSLLLALNSMLTTLP